VTELGNGRSHWVARGFGGFKFEWDAEVFNDIRDELIAWRSLEPADVVNAGSVRFQKGPAGRGTYVRVTMNYNSPGGRGGAALAEIFGGEPAQLIRKDLRRLKQILETGELASIEGQASGRAPEAEPLGELPAATTRYAAKTQTV
jgi:uncharacterized membrane protein